MRADGVAGNQSGMALVLTLLTISFLVAVTVQLMITVDRQITAAAAQREQVRLDGLVLAGLNLARAALSVASPVSDQENQNKDQGVTHEAWTDFDPDKLNALAGGEATLKVTVSDLSGRLQINPLGDADKEAYRQIWLRLLLSGRYAMTDRKEAEALLDALADWIDQDDEERHEGAEQGYYRGRTPPYSCRNGPVVTVEELLLVKGMTPALLFGDDRHEALANAITVIGDDGKVNLRAAPEAVLEVLSPEMTRELARELIVFREDRQNSKLLADPGWYRQVPGMPISVDFGSELLKGTGEHFQVRIEATAHQFRRTGTGMLHRQNEQRSTLLSWKLE